jgi:long-chain fatty acid transport protein
MSRSHVAVAWSLVTVLLAAAPPAAHAAGFQLFEQSGRALGSAYAGEAAIAADATTIFYNPAGLTLLDGTQVAASGFLVWTHFFFENRGSHLSDSVLNSAGVGGEPLTGGNGGNAGSAQPLSSGFISHRLTDRVSLGLGVSTPFGLQTDWPRGWVGRYSARFAQVQSFNFNPSLAVRVTDWLSLGGGADAEYVNATLTNNIDVGSGCQVQGPKLHVPSAACIPVLHLQPQKIDAYANLKGNSWAAGYNFGALLRPTSSTRIGVTYRSRLQHDIEGFAEFRVPKNGRIVQTQGQLISTPASVPVTFPDRASISLFQQVFDDWAFLADFSWTHWSLFNKLQPHFANPKQLPLIEHEDWNDSERYALGVVWTPSKVWTGRFGTAYDFTPIPDREHRTPRIPDADRIWLTFGLGYRPTTRLHFDVSYGHIFSPRVSTRNSTPLTGELVGNFRSFGDLFAFQVTYDIDWTFSDPWGEPM